MLALSVLPLVKKAVIPDRFFQEGKRGGCAAPTR